MKEPNLEGFPLFELDGPTLCMGLDMNQNRMAVPVWSYAMEKYPPQRIIEIGSYNGGFALALAFAGWNEGVTVYSYDVMEAPKEEWRDLARFLQVHFLLGNCFGLEEEIRQLVQQPGVTFLLCDGGDKPREFNTFAKHLKPGDVIAAHDFGTIYWPWVEISLDRVAGAIEREQLRRWMPDVFNLGGWLAFVKPVNSVDKLPFPEV